MMTAAWDDAPHTNVWEDDQGFLHGDVPEPGTPEGRAFGYRLYSTKPTAWLIAQRPLSQRAADRGEQAGIDEVITINTVLADRTLTADEEPS